MNMNQGDRFLIYQGRNKRWYWHLTRSNNRVIADQAQGNGYLTRGEARDAAARTKEAATNATIEDAQAAHATSRRV